MDNRAIIQKSLDYIEDNLQTEIAAGELADMAGFSLFHYYRLFQQATGLPVMQYILRRRLLHGVYAISRGSTKVDAALNYGFDTYAGFYKAFCREFGCTPSAFLASSRARRPWRVDITKEEALAERYEVSWSSLILVDYDKSGKERATNLTEFAFGNARTASDKCKEGLSERITEMLNN